MKRLTGKPKENTRKEIKKLKVENNAVKKRKTVGKLIN